MKFKRMMSLALAAGMLASMANVSFADGAKWSEEKTSSGWIKVTQEGGPTLGYSEKSGVKILEDDGFAFKDLNQNGELDTYEDWRLSYEERAAALAASIPGEEAIHYLTHGGWGTFSTTEIAEDNKGYEYITAGGRGGVTRNAGATTEANADHAKWANLVQELSESTFYGIPSLISIDPNGQSKIVETLSLASLMDPEEALEVGKQYSKQYRAMGINMMLGPQIDLMTSPVMDRGTGTYGEDPALTRDIGEAFVSGMQSTWNGTEDLGWGSDSVLNVMKHYAGAGASEGGRDDHNEIGRFSIFPNDSFETHLIPFFDGTFNLQHSSTGSAGSIMTNYSVAYSKDGSLGDLVAGAYSEFKFALLKQGGWDGLIISDWGVWAEGGKIWGMEDYTTAERVARSVTLGMCQTGGFGDMEVMDEAYEIMVDELGEDEAQAIVQDRARHNILATMRLGAFENPYVLVEDVYKTNCTEETVAYGLDTQTKSVVMLKNDGTIKAADANAEKLTVYIPAKFVPATTGWVTSPAAIKNSVDVELASKYYNVITDTIGEPSGTDAEGKPAYVPEDIVRASAEEIAEADLILVGMSAPKTKSVKTTDEDGVDTWFPASIQYNEYTAVNAKEQSVAGNKIIEQFNDGYEIQTKETIENRSYKGNSVGKDANYGMLETLQFCSENKGDAKVIVLMNQSGSGAMVWSEVEPLADVILNGYKVTDEAFLRIVAGEAEPSGLLVTQQPASMDAVELQKGEDLPRDLECYVDANGNTYDFAYGLNWSGVIDDARTQTYKAEPLVKLAAFEFEGAK